MLERLSPERPEVPVPGLPRFTGGVVGYLGYDTVRLIEHLPDAPEDVLGLPDAVWGLYKELVAFDHVRHQVVLIAQAFCDAPEDDARALDDAHAALDALADALRRTPEPPRRRLELGEALPDASAARRTRRRGRGQAAHLRGRHLPDRALAAPSGVPFDGDAFSSTARSGR